MMSRASISSEFTLRHACMISRTCDTSVAKSETMLIIAPKIMGYWRNEIRKKDRASIRIYSNTLPAAERERIRILHAPITHLQPRIAIATRRRQVILDND